MPRVPGGAQLQVIVLRSRLAHFLLLLATLFALHLAPVLAQEAKQVPERVAASGVLSMLPADSRTEHVLDLGRERLAYTALAGTLPLKDQNGELSAAVFYTAYTLSGAEAPSRPLTFAFNGGPGAASVYLHLGLVGPTVLEFGPKPDGSEAQLRPNPDTWLKFTDLVLIDPVGSGWSRAAKADGAGAFWGVRQDAQALAKVIALYVARNNRTASPKYLLGESYGGFRAAKVAQALKNEQGIVANGIVMVSPFLDGALTFGGRSPLVAALQLPALAAAELDATNSFSEEALRAAERFAMTDYLTTLAGRPPSAEAGRGFYAQVAALTGLPLEVVVRARGFVRDAYVQHARAARKQVVSAYDATFAVPDPYPESTTREGGDPVLDGFTQALGGAFVGYARENLGFKTDMTFHLLNREVSGKWDWGGGGRSRASASHELRELLAFTPTFRVLVAHGRSDIVTPYGASRYVLDHLPEFTYPRTKLVLYKGGHMFYFDREARAAFTAEAASFYRGGGP